jgi:hypothetical protein
MYNGDRSRKENLVNYGFRLPSALDNRPLKFEEFIGKTDQMLFVSATPGPYELEQTKGEFVEQIIRPTGLLDPIIEVKNAKNQVDEMLVQAKKTIKEGGRVLITTLTIKYGRRSTGLIYSASLFSIKAGILIGGFLVPLFLARFGYEKGAATQTAHALLGITIAFSIGPALFALLKAVALMIYPLDQKRVDEIERELAARRAAVSPESKPA